MIAEDTGEISYQSQCNSQSLKVSGVRLILRAQKRSPTAIKSKVRKTVATARKVKPLGLSINGNMLEIN